MLRRLERKQKWNYYRRGEASDRVVLKNLTTRCVVLSERSAPPSPPMFFADKNTEIEKEPGWHIKSQWPYSLNSCP